MNCVQRTCWLLFRRLFFGDQPSSTGSTGGACPEGDIGDRRHLLSGSPLDSAVLASHRLLLRFSSLCQRGYYPDFPESENQETLSIKTQLQGNPNLHLFAVFDGHGDFGAQCAAFARDRLVDHLAGDPHLLDDPLKSFNSAFLATNSELHDSEIDDTMSGTTATVVVVGGDTLFIANVGDARAVVGVWNGECVVAENLSSDQWPLRKNEYERVRRSGATVLSVEQVEGINDPAIQSWDMESVEDPPRLWVQNEMYPGAVFTRSIGNTTAESIGAIAEPEVMTVKITPNHLFFVVASDGVFEFLSSQDVVDMVSRYPDPRDACSIIAAESYKLWLDHDDWIDDITIIVVHIEHLPDSFKKSDQSDAVATNEASHTSTKASLMVSHEARIDRSAFLGSETCHPKRGDCLQLQSCPSDFFMERNLACIAPPTHFVCRNVIYPD